MNYKLTGYEGDKINIKAFFVYAISAIALFILILFSVLIYYNYQREEIYKETVLQDEIDKTVEYKRKQKEILQSYNIDSKNGVSMPRVPIEMAMKKIVEFYND